MKKYKQVKDAEDLARLVGEGVNEYSIILNGGLRSSKYITYNDATHRFSVWNEIDDTRQSFTHKTIMEDGRSNIGKAIRAGVFIYDAR